MPAAQICRAWRFPLKAKPPSLVFTHYTKNEINSATKNPVPPTSVSIMVHVFNVVFHQVRLMNVPARNRNR